MVVQVDPVGVGVKWTFDIYDFLSWVLMCGAAVRKHDLSGFGFNG